MRPLLLAVLTTGVLTYATDASAADPGNYNALGVGTGSCGSWTAARRNPYGLQTLANQQWVLGFLSGIGFMGAGVSNPLNGVDAEGVWAWIDSYCRDRPLDLIGRSAAAFSIAHPR